MFSLPPHYLQLIKELGDGLIALGRALHRFKAAEEGRELNREESKGALKTTFGLKQNENAAARTESK